MELCYTLTTFDGITAILLRVLTSVINTISVRSRNSFKVMGLLQENERTVRINILHSIRITVIIASRLPCVINVMNLTDFSWCKKFSMFRSCMKFAICFNLHFLDHWGYSVTSTYMPVSLMVNSTNNQLSYSKNLRVGTWFLRTSVRLKPAN